MDGQHAGIAEGTAVVVGLGHMGTGIAQLLAQRGVTTTLVDRSEELATQSRARIGHTLDVLVQRQKLTTDEAAAAMARLVVGDRSAVRGASLVIEAVPEDEALKASLLARLGADLAPDALLVSNTSSISIARLAAATTRPESFLGLHFLYPVPVMPVVEVIRGPATSDAAYERVLGWVKRLGKEALPSGDAPGFLLNRMLLPLINEACRALDEGVGTVEQIDTTARRGLGHPIGPLELADIIGLDVVQAVLDVLASGLEGAHHRPATGIVQRVSHGHLGKKTGAGFYRWHGGRPVR